MKPYHSMGLTATSKGRIIKKAFSSMSNRLT